MNSKIDSDYEYILKRYEDSITYYWKASSKNKKAYKITRSLVVILGAVVTLITSLSSASFIESINFWNIFFAVSSPLLAAILTIVGGFSQSFHWGAAWRDMVINAQTLEKERDRFKVIKPEDCDLAKEVEILNNLVLQETQTFFQRIIGGAKTNKL